MKSSITGSAKVFAHERTKGDGTKFIEYTTSEGKKKEDGTWENAYPRVRFAKCQPPQIKAGESTSIEIEEGFWAYEGNYVPKFNGQPITRANGKPMEIPIRNIVVLKYHEGAPQSPLPDSFATVDEDEPW